MTHFTTTIKDPIGLHARPASALTQAASKFDNKTAIFIHWGTKMGNLKSIMNVMALGVMHGAEIKIEANGPQAEEAIKTIKQVMIENHLI